jgi:hypothetical protein
LSWPPSLRRAGLAELPLCTHKEGPRHTIRQDDEVVGSIPNPNPNPNPPSCDLPRTGGADERGEEAAAEVRALPRRGRTEPSPRPDARPRPLPCSVQRAADKSGVLSPECVLGLWSKNAAVKSALIPPQLCERVAEATRAAGFIMEPGWLVLLISLFVQMFFTVLVSLPRLRLGDRARKREATWHALQPAHAKTVRRSWLRRCRPTQCAAFSWKRCSPSPRSRGSSTQCGARSRSTYSTSGATPSTGLQPAAAGRGQHRERPFPRVVPCTAHRYTIEGLTHMGRDLGILSPVEYAISCEAKQDMFRQERRGQPCWLGSPDLDPPGSQPWQRSSSQRYPSLSFSLSLSLSLARISTRARSLLSRSATR